MASLTRYQHTRRNLHAENQIRIPDTNRIEDQSDQTFLLTSLLDFPGEVELFRRRLRSLHDIR